MKKQEFQDDIVKEVIGKNAYKLSSHDFEDKVMSRIQYEAALKTQVSNRLKLSLIFFVIGTILGVGGTIFLMLFFDSILGFSPRDFGFILLFVISTVSIMSFDNFKRLINTYS